jgi:hypothetical protein
MPEPSSGQRLMMNFAVRGVDPISSGDLKLISSMDHSACYVKAKDPFSE